MNSKKSGLFFMLLFQKLRSLASYGSLSENFVMEKRLMASLVKDDFTALGLEDYGVEIHIDDLSKEEILEYIDRENFNAIKYLKQDYFNFKKYIGAEFYPRHVDYINNDSITCVYFIQKR